MELFAKFKKILRRDFRATLNFGKSSFPSILGLAAAVSFFHNEARFTQI